MPSIVSRFGGAPLCNLALKANTVPSFPLWAQLGASACSSAPLPGKGETPGAERMAQRFSFLRLHTVQERLDPIPKFT